MNSVQLSRLVVVGFAIALSLGALSLGGCGLLNSLPSLLNEGEPGQPAPDPGEECPRDNLVGCWSFDDECACEGNACLCSQTLCGCVGEEMCSCFTGDNYDTEIECEDEGTIDSECADVSN